MTRQSGPMAAVAAGIAAVVLACPLGLWGQTKAGPAGLDVSKGAAFVVAHPAKPLPVEKTAAEELAAYLAKSAGLQTRVLGEDNLTAPDAADAYVGACAYTKSAGLCPETPAEESFVVKTQGGKLFIFGQDAPGAPFSSSTATGTLYGVYDFIENELGAIWIWPGESGEFLPRRDGLHLPALDRRQQPRFIIREMIFGYLKYEPKPFNDALGPWRKRMKLSWVPKAWFGHSWGTHLLGNKAVVEAHPDWLALYGGMRRGPHLCTSNQALRDYIVDSVIADADTKKNRIVSISPSDGYGFCECEKCRALDPPGTDYSRDIPNLSNRHWDYANSIAREVKKRRPDLGVGMFAYTAYRQPPTNMDRIEDNIYISFTFSTAYFVKPELKKEVYAEIAGWKAKHAKLVAREYWGMHYWLDLPYVFTREIAQATPELADLGMVAMYGETGKNFATQGPNYFLAAHLMWDPKADGAAILDRYYRAFGPAAGPVRKYYETFETALRENSGHIRDFGYHSLINSWPEVFPAQTIQQAGRHLAEAQAAVRGQAEFERRVEVVRVGYEYTQTMIELLGLYRTLGRAGVPLWFFSREGDEAQAAFFKLPGGKLPASQAEYWKDKPTQPRPRAELIKLLERAKFLGDERERILNQYAELPALSRGLYQMTVDEGIRPWHQTVKAELEKLTKSTEEEKK